MGEREVGGDWGQIGGMLHAWVLWEPQWHRERGELASFPVLQWLLCLQSHAWAPVLIGVVSLTWEQCGQHVGVLKCSELQG